MSGLTVNVNDGKCFQYEPYIDGSGCMGDELCAAVDDWNSNYLFWGGINVP